MALYTSSLNAVSKTGFLSLLPNDNINVQRVTHTLPKLWESNWEAFMEIHNYLTISEKLMREQLPIS